MAAKILSKKILGLTSVAFCLEDSIADNAVEQAEQTLTKTLGELAAGKNSTSELPLIFVRVRNPAHLTHVHELLADRREMIAGYVLPKFDLTNATAYLLAAQEINADSSRPFYVMPTLETRPIADMAARTATLMQLKTMLDDAGEIILNVRVGANDFCELYGLRRGIDQTIYDVGVVRDILLAILNVFAADYVVSGPVWNYFGREPQGAWRRGLERELKLDRLNGFIGKTAVHPSQVPLIFKSLQVSPTDLEDAKKILAWKSEELGVEKSTAGDRMNEVKCQHRWAERIIRLAKIYGIKEHFTAKPAAVRCEGKEGLSWLSTAPPLAFELPDAMAILDELIYW